MIDTNVHLFHWPFRRLAGDDPAELVRRLKEKGVRQAWAGSFEALLCRDVAGVNSRLADACSHHCPDFLVPFGCVNPKFPDWPGDLRRCHEVHRMRGIRLYPNYHGYTLADPVVADLFSRAAARRLMVQIVFCMEDERTQFPLMRVPPVDPAPLAEIVRRVPDLKLVLLNGGGWDGDESRGLRELAREGRVYCDMARVEGIEGLADLIRSFSPTQVMFGSSYPFFYFEAALLKVKSAGLAQDGRAALLEGNARVLLPEL
ncbi:MAG TPA: amidohydrolase family protein [Alloacidobacterium sp.]|nr:amidohydrolase family protein [Alloacidobacterium sp.]